MACMRLLEYLVYLEQPCMRMLEVLETRAIKEREEEEEIQRHQTGSFKDRSALLQY